MKKIIFNLILCLSFLFSFAKATMLDECYKIYSKDADSLFMNTLSAINSNSKFNVVEIQSRNGYILFLVGSKYYLVTVTKRYQNQTEVKVLPQNSDYSEGSDIAKIVFGLIDYQLKNQPMEQVK